MSRSLRSLSLLTCLLLVAALVAGCASGSAPSAAATTQPAGTSGSNQTTAPATAGDAAGQPLHKLTDTPTTMTIWFRSTPSLGKVFKSYEDTTLFREMAKRTNVSLKFDTPVLGQEQDKFQILIASNNYPDLIFGVGAYYNGGGDKAINDNVVLKLNDYIAKEAPDYAAMREITPAVKKATITDSGNIYQFSVIVQGDAEPPYTGLSIRQDWLDELNLKAPVTYDDMHNVLVQFKEKKGATKAFSLDASGIPGRAAFTGGLGFYANFPSSAFPTNEYFYQVDGKVKYAPLEPGFKEYVTMMAQWYSEGLVDKDFLSVKTQNDFVPIVSKGECGIASLSHAQWPTYKASSDDHNFRLVALANPVKNAGDKIHVVQRNNVTFEDWGVAISTQCKNPDLAVKYMNSYYTPEATVLVNYGVEGEGMVMVNGKPTLSDLVLKNPDKLSLVDAISKYATYMFPSYRDYTRFYIGNSDDQLNASKVWLSNADTAYMMPVTTMTTSEASSYAEVMNDINTTAQETTIKMIMGLIPLTDYDKMVTTIQGMGIDKAIAAKQAAFDRFNAR